MDHEEALRLQAAERYLLGEMEGAEREAFEEHFFVCADCAEALTDNAALADNARAVFREQEQRHRPAVIAPPRMGFWKFFFPAAPVFAALLLAVIAGYLRFVTIPGMRNRLASATALQSVPAFALHSISRGAAEVVEVPRDARFYTVFVDLPAENVASYICEIRNASGSLRASLSVPKSETSDTLNLLLDPSRTPPGDYTLVVRASTPGSPELGRYSFEICFK